MQKVLQPGASALASLLCSLVCGCNDITSPPAVAPLDLPNDQVWTSPHFRYAARADDPSVCSGVVDQLENHLRVVTGYLGLTWQGDVINYYKFRDQEDLSRNSGCSPLAKGCSPSSRDARSVDILSGHELVHVYLWPLGLPPPLFTEGIAMALQPEGHRFYGFAEWNWRDILATPRVENAPPDSSAYKAGGWFVSYLLRQFGPAPFLAFYGAIGQTANPSATEIDTQFKQVYGRELDDLWSEAKSNAPFLFGVPVWDCASAKAMVLGGDTVPETGACDGSGNSGALELPVPTTFTWADMSQIDFGIASCAPVDGFYTAFSLYFGLGTVTFPAGKYYVVPGQIESGGPDGAASFSRSKVRFQDTSGAPGPDCNSLTPFALRKYYKEYVVAIANTAAPWFAKPQISGGQSFHLERMMDYQFPTWDQKMVATVEICDTCQGPCHLMDPMSEATVSNGVVLRFTNLNAREGVTVIRFGLGFPID